MSSTADRRVAAFYMAKLPLADLLPINQGMSSATENTMISIMDSPRVPLTTRCQNRRASDVVKALAVTQRMTDRFRLTGVKPAILSVKEILNNVFSDHPDLKKVLSTEGMLCTRFRKPTSGRRSTKISNHSWGTAIDFKIVGHKAPRNTGTKVPRFIAVMLPYFNNAGWYSGIAFRDSMHFEVSEETIRIWSMAGLIKP